MVYLAAISSIAYQNVLTETNAVHVLHLVVVSTDSDAAEPDRALAVGEVLNEINSLGDRSLPDSYVLQNETVFISEVR